MTVGPLLALTVALLSLVCLSFVMRAARGRVRPSSPIGRRGRPYPLSARQGHAFPLTAAPWRPSRRQRRLLQKLDRVLSGTEPPPAAAIWLPRLHQPTIERIAADLRRLNRQRLGVATWSLMWRKAILDAYDEQLRMASRCLGVVEYLSELDGVDRDIERLRVEGELQTAGLYLSEVSAYPRRP